MKTINRGLVGTVAAGAMALASASPAQARHDRDGIDAGDVIAGALIIGGIAAIAAASSRDRDDRDYDYGRGGYRDYDGYGYHGRGNAREAVERCIHAAEDRATRYSYGRADVTDIRSVDRTRNGYRITGRIAVNTRGHHGWRPGERRYGDGWDGDYRGWNAARHWGYDSGRFTCEVRHGRVAYVDFSGLRGLR